MASSPRNALIGMLSLATFALPGPGCGGAPTAIAPVGSDSFDMTSPAPAPRPPRPRHARGLPPDVVERAARDFLGLRADGQALSSEELFRELERANVLCVGEDPTDVSHHFAALTVLRELEKRAPARGIELGLGLEMFSVRDQNRLDEYASREIGEHRLLRETHYREDWQHDFALYRPLVEHAQWRGVALLALGAAPDLIHKIARDGLEALTPDEVDSLPELDVDSEAHRQSYDRHSAQGPKTGSGADHSYAADVVAVETAADRAARWVAARRPARQLMVVARMKNCEHTAIPARLLRRGVGIVVSLRPMSEGRAEALQSVPEGFDYGFVMDSGARRTTAPQ